MIIFIPFFLGLIVGSFLNSLIYQLEENQSFWRKRSICPHCKNYLSWKDLIPLFSFLILRGKCRYCQKPISLQYPLVEFFTALLFVLIFNHSLLISEPVTFKNFLIFFYHLVVGSFLIVIFVFDLKHYLIPDRIIYFLIFLSFFWNLIFAIFFEPPQKTEIIENFLAILATTLFFLTIVLISRERWMGFGDVKLALFISLYLGFPKVLIALFLSFFIGGFVGTILIFLRKKTLKSEIPFAPFLVTGTFLSLFFGEKIIATYLGIFW
jgi:leader peptidase (prepilin peptidase)/N-methyltransferase